MENIKEVKFNNGREVETINIKDCKTDCIKRTIVPTIQLRRAKTMSNISTVVLNEGEPTVYYDIELLKHPIKKHIYNRTLFYIGDGKTELGKLCPINGRINRTVLSCLAIAGSVISLIISILSMIL